MVSNDLVAQLLPTLGRSLEVGFNVFDVMHHGTHEKQLSNVFGWIFEIGGTHNFAALGQQLFVDLINEQRTKLGQISRPLPAGPYTVRQEVNTAPVGAAADIADIVLESDSAVIVVENYGSSDGHGHSYERYLTFGRRAGKQGVVVLLCALVADLAQDPRYAEQNAEQYAFIIQMHRRFASGRGRMSDTELLDFVTAMCSTGEAKRYQERDRELAAERFASDLAQQARERFGEGREVLQRVKARLRSYASTILGPQLNATLGEGFVQSVTAGYSGIFQWTINLETAGDEPAGEAGLQIKFGPSAWYANEQDDYWKQKVTPGAADYSRLFLTSPGRHEIRQSAVLLRDVLEGLAPDDARLHEEILALLGVHPS